MPENSIIDVDEIRAQIKLIVESTQLGNSSRLQDFLSFIVEEALAGRSDRLKGLVIARAVFAADDSFDPVSNSIVRVEAGRLRRRLKEYYAAEGRHDAIIVDIPIGSYAPRFSVNPASIEEKSPGHSAHRFSLTSNNRWLIPGISVFVIVLALAWHFLGGTGLSSRNVTSLETNQNQTIETEAQILMRQAFVLLMPPENKARLENSIDLFQHLIDSEPGFAGGYAGKSLAYSIGVLFIKSDDPAEDLRQAAKMAERAIQVNPDYGLGYAALALAQSLGSENDKALDNARRAVAIRPRAPMTNAMTSLVLLNSDMPLEAIDVLAEALRISPNEPRTPFLNMLGIAQYVSGDYEGAAGSFEKNLSRNGPTGPHIEVFMAATYAQMGNDFQARAIVEKLQRSYPAYPVEAWLKNYIKSEDDLQKTLSELRLLGLSNS